MSYTLLTGPDPTPRCCGDEMVELKDPEIGHWLCVWCDRVANDAEPMMQRLKRLVPPPGRTSSSGPR